LLDRTINPLTEVTISVGASEAIFAIMQSLLNEGDEVVVLEPAFDM
jgi:aspartate/methionine/tyrosine aminotransferase